MTKRKTSKVRCRVKNKPRTKKKRGTKGKRKRRNKVTKRKKGGGGGPVDISEYINKYIKENGEYGINVKSIVRSNITDLFKVEIKDSKPIILKSTDTIRIKEFIETLKTEKRLSK